MITTYSSKVILITPCNKQSYRKEKSNYYQNIKLIATNFSRKLYECLSLLICIFSTFKPVKKQINNYTRTCYYLFMIIYSN